MVTLKKNCVSLQKGEKTTTNNRQISESLKCSWLDRSDWGSVTLRAPRLGSTPGLCFTLVLRHRLKKLLNGTHQELYFTDSSSFPFKTGISQDQLHPTDTTISALVSCDNACKLPPITGGIIIFDNDDVIHTYVSLSCCRLSKFSFRHLVKNSFASCWTRLKRFLQNLSADGKTPDGERTFVFMVSK